MRGRKLITEIQSNSDDHITKVKISPCNHYIICGLKSGIVKKTTIRTKEQKDILNVNSAVVYMNFVNSDLLMVAGKNRCLMAYMLKENGEWKPEMLERGNANLGSQEILNDIQGYLIFFLTLLYLFFQINIIGDHDCYYLVWEDKVNVEFYH